MFGYYAKQCRAGLRVGTFVTEGALGQRGMVPQAPERVEQMGVGSRLRSAFSGVDDQLTDRRADRILSGNAP